jgi:hypothetical protein
MGHYYLFFDLKSNVISSNIIMSSGRQEAPAAGVWTWPNKPGPCNFVGSLCISQFGEIKVSYHII